MREVPISDLKTSEGGDKSSEDLNGLLSEGYNMFYAVLVFEQDDKILKLVDGHHRLTEMKSLGELTIPAYVIPLKVSQSQEKKKGWYGQNW